MVLSDEARLKTAFVSAYGKWEFKRCPFGLAQAPAYFQRLINEVLSGFTFAFGVLDDILIYSSGRILRMAHDELGHNGTHRTYTILKRLYCWKGLKPNVERHIKMCYQCQRRNKQVVKYTNLHFDVATFPMQFISMDLIGKFHPPTRRKH